jgi:hypothetical protein
MYVRENACMYACMQASINMHMYSYIHAYILTWSPQRNPRLPWIGARFEAPFGNNLRFSMHMYACMYVCMCVYTHVHKSTRDLKLNLETIFDSLCTCMYVCMHSLACIPGMHWQTLSVYTYIHVYVHACHLFILHLHAILQIIYISMHRHTHTDTHPQSASPVQLLHGYSQASRWCLVQKSQSV